MEIVPPGRDETAPRIVMPRKKARLLFLLLPAGIVALYFFPYGTFIGFVMLFTFLVLSHDVADRCGHCGVTTHRPRATYCQVCGVQFDCAVE
jgi:hypothetical protein